MAKVLIVDDDASFRGGLAETVSDHAHEVIETASGEEALPRASACDLIFLDLRMPGMGGLEFLRRIKADPERAQVPVVILTAYADSANTIEAMKLGAFDHLTKPIGREDVETVLTRALDRPQVRPAATKREGDEFIGGSPAMREVQKLIGLAAASDALVLIQGETGTGKEMVARAIHGHSERQAKPFVPVNCAAIPAELLESELFGHVRGAFTGAVQARSGRFREAEGGTLFLDEIGDMTLLMQAKILRVLQDRMVTPIGGSSAQRVNARIVTATHHDLVASVRGGRFREDLFYRINVLTIPLPPLRERGADILALAEFFLRRGPAPKQLSTAAAKALLEHGWQGNVRELENRMQRASLIARSDVVGRSDLELGEAPVTSESVDEWLQLDFHEAIGRLEKLLLRRALQASGGNRTEAARKLGIRRQLLYAKLEEHGL